MGADINSSIAWHRAQLKKNRESLKAPKPPGSPWAR